jgi:hypothetical protein
VSIDKGGSRDAQLVGPVSLYVLAVAESGERKTTCDRILGAALREWERDRTSAAAGCAGSRRHAAGHSRSVSGHPRSR